MSYASFATLDEAWGGVGEILPPVQTPLPDRSARHKSIGIPGTLPEPSDVGYSRSGAPIMDDIVNMCTPADVKPAVQALLLPAVTPLRTPSPADDTRQVSQQPRQQVQAQAQKQKKQARKGDDYSDEEDATDVTFSQRRASKRDRQEQGGDDTAKVIELAAYVLSGVMLIFLFESFIGIGGSLRGAQSLY